MVYCYYNFYLKVNIHHYGEEPFDPSQAGKTIDLRNQPRYNLYLRQPQYVTSENRGRVQVDDYYEAVLTIRNFQASDSGG